jgi:hypothetical protein
MGILSFPYTRIAIFAYTQGGNIVLYIPGCTKYSMCEEKHDLKDAEDVDIVEVEGESAAVLECEGAKLGSGDGGRRGGALAGALALALA